MFRFVCLLVGALTIAIVAVASRGQPDAQGPPPTDQVRLIPHGGVRYTQPSDGVEIQAGPGALRTNRFYVDVVMRFQFQFAEPDTDATVSVRSVFSRQNRPPSLGSRIHLSQRTAGDRALGRVSSWGSSESVQPLVAAPLRLAAGDWQEAEVRISRATLTARINGVETTRTEITHLVGYLGFHVDAGRLRIRGLQIEQLPLASDGFPGAAVRLGAGIQDPSVVKAVRPFYSIAAMTERVQGNVAAEAIVREDGTVGDVRITKPLHPDLDASALAAAREWRFRPATRNGQPVAVVVSLDLAFKIF
jgi:TonB family protein